MVTRHESFHAIQYYFFYNIILMTLSRSYPFGDSFGLGKEEQVVVSARLGIRTRHIEPSEGMGAH